MPTIYDSEFGEIIVRKNRRSTNISLRVAPDGRLRVSAPTFTPLTAIKFFIKTSRKEIREILSKHHQNQLYDKNMPIGKSHSLVIQPGTTTQVQTVGNKIVVQLAPGIEITDRKIQTEIRQAVIKSLRKEAKKYLPQRLQFLAKEHNFDHKSVRLTHASSRWGSCSSSGTISLNIALMKLPFELIDYVIIHELCHTKQMNHSTEFWQIVAEIDPSYKNHRQQLKKHTPYV